jgi:hypothetical protein
MHVAEASIKACSVRIPFILTPWLVGSTKKSTGRKLNKRKCTYRILIVLEDPAPFLQPVITTTLSPVLWDSSTIRIQMHSKFFLTIGGVGGGEVKVLKRK